MEEIKQSADTNSGIYHDSVAIRKEVFVEEQNVPQDLEIDNLEDKCTYFNIYLEDQPVATARFFPTADHGIHIQRVAVRSKYRQRNLGSKLIQAILTFAKEKGYSYAILGAQDHAQDFYKKLGFQVIGDQYVEAGIKHHDMKLNL